MSPFRLFSQHGELVFELSKREVLDKYAGQLLGVLWAVLHPFFVMGVYVVVFGLIMGLRFEREMPLNYSAYLLAGLIPWLAVVDVLSKSAVVLPANRSLIKQVVFPVEVLPVKGVLATVFTQLVFWFFFIAYTAIDSGRLSLMWLLLPFLLVGQTFFLMGVAFVVSVIAAVLRDIKDIVQLVAVVGLYLLPIIYLPDMLPPWMDLLIDYNPLSHMVWVFQDVMFYGAIQHPVSWLVWILTTIISYFFGALMFQKLKLILANYM